MDPINEGYQEALNEASGPEYMVLGLEPDRKADKVGMYKLAISASKTVSVSADELVAAKFTSNGKGHVFIKFAKPLMWK